jgi:uncharacterized protein (DUF1800 family)
MRHGSLLACLLVAALSSTAAAQRPGPAPGGAAMGPTAIPRVPQGAGTASSTAKRPYDQQRLLAGHLLRRVGFGPTPAELQRVLAMGRQAYVDEQLTPQSIDDSEAEARFFPVDDPLVDDFGQSHTFRWLTRMVYSRRQLQEKMTLIWHEHLPVSIGKIGQGKPMHDYEEVLRRNALGSFRQLLVDITRDNAMLIYLDNNFNSAFDFRDGSPVPPNENYARELLQLFALGTERLNMDGTPVVGPDDQPLPAYTETDVREVARALTGFYVDDYRTWGPSKFYEGFHDPGTKTILGATVAGRRGADGANEVGDVVDAIMRHPSTAPYISKILIQKLATETPAPAYVARVAAVFKSTDGDIRATVRAILLDPEFTSDAVVRSQIKEPLETLIQPIRALDGETHGASLYFWSYLSHQLPYYPPSVFSFYRPGKRAALLTSSQVAYLDYFADDLVDDYHDDFTDATFDAGALIRDFRLKKPKKTVDFLADRLLAAPLETSTRQALVDYFGGRVTEEKLRGAVWLIITSPDFQLN